MKNPTFERNVAQLENPPQQTINARHTLRPLITSAHPALTDPFLFLMEDWFGHGVFDNHPHRGIETVTYVLEGQLEHQDNGKNKGILNPGDVQWMTAGRGVIHNEQPAKGQRVHSLQLWVNLSSAHKMVEPGYQTLSTDNLPIRYEEGTEVRIFSGSSGKVVSPTRNYTPILMLEIRLAPRTHFQQELPAHFNAFLLVLEGQGFVGTKRTEVHSNHIAWLTRSEENITSWIDLASADEPLRLLLYAGQPLKEPVIAHGPFVMNTREEIRQAYADYRAGKFGPLP